MTREMLKDVGTVVVKVGSSLLASICGGVNKEFINRLVGQIADLAESGRKVVLVSSGAVAAGTAELGMNARPIALPEIQAAAAVGQGALMEIYRSEFAPRGIKVGQVLLTRDGLVDRRRFLHARNTLCSLLEHSVIPIVNENDTVAVEELKLKMGDNDGLAVSVAQLVEADCLILLTDVPGLYDKSPDEEDAELISHVKELTQEIIDCAGGSTSGLGLGGMSTKLNAALAATMSAIPLVVADGKEDGVLHRIISGEEVGTFFSPRKKRTSLRQQWIAFGRKPEGTLVIDDGAVNALVSGKKSLLPIGIKEVKGEFGEADTVVIESLGGAEIARGLSNFTSDEVRKIMGRRSDELSEILGCDCCENVVHRDNLVVIKEAAGA